MSIAMLPRRRILALLSFLAVSGCSTSPTQPSHSAWEAQIAGVGEYAALSGYAAVASQFGGADVFVELTGVGGAKFTWRIVRGSCSEPGSGLGSAASYPELEIPEAGTASVKYRLNQMLEIEGGYALVVRATDSEVAACGDLRRKVF